MPAEPATNTETYPTGLRVFIFLFIYKVYVNVNWSLLLSVIGLKIKMILPIDHMNLYDKF